MDCIGLVAKITVHSSTARSLDFVNLVFCGMDLLAHKRRIYFRLMEKVVRTSRANNNGPADMCKLITRKILLVYTFVISILFELIFFFLHILLYGE